MPTWKSASPTSRNSQNSRKRGCFPTEETACTLVQAVSFSGLSLLRPEVVFAQWPFEDMFVFRKGYFWLGTAILLAEIAIALFVHDGIIRPYIGDFLAVILVYCFLRSFLNQAVLPLAMVALLVAYLLEAAQYFQVLNRLGLQHFRAAHVILGTAFSWIDMVTYTAGFLAIIGAEKIRAELGRGRA
jgi:hypothetical protein